MPPTTIPATGTPTARETDALAALVRGHIPSPKPPPRVLAEVLSLCQNPDVLAFLFTDDPIEVPYLTSSSMTTSAITGTMTSTRVEPAPHTSAPRRSLPEYVGPASDHVHGKWVFVPAFIVSGVVMGFGMHEFNYSPGFEWNSDTMLHMRVKFRFVRNDATAEMLLVHDIPEMNAQCVEYTRTVTPTCQTRTSVCFWRDKLRQIAHRGVLDANTALPAIDQINTIYEYRPCPSCACDQTACRCTLHIARAKHPFDMSCFANNMAHRLGEFQGVGSLFSYDGVTFNTAASLGCRNVVRGGVDHDLIRSMRDWSLNLHLSGSEHPLQTIITSADSATEHPPLLRNSPSSSASPPGTAAYRDDAIDHDEDAPHHMFLEGWLDDGALWLDAGDTHRLADDDVRHEHALTTLPSLDDCASLFVVDTESASRADSWIKTCTAGSPTARRIATDTGLAYEAGLLPLLDLDGKAAIKAGDGSRCAGSGDSGRSSNGRRDGNANDGGINLVRLMKAELRRKRNRESAQRSNEKKKALNNALKRDIKDCKTRAEFLRTAETGLREENLRLRRLLSDSSAPS